MSGGEKTLVTFWPMFLTWRFFISITLIALLSAVGHWWPPAYPAAVVLLVVQVVLSLADALLLLSMVQVRGGREVEARLNNGAPNPVKLFLENQSRLLLRVRFHDETPVGIPVSSLSRQYQPLPPAHTLRTSYTLTPNRRGAYRFGRMLCFATTRLGMWERRLLIAPSSEVKVYPDFAHLKEREQQYRLGQDLRQGERRRRSAGNSTDFEEIRDYAIGDNYRAVNWKATARRGRLLVNHYAEERAQLIYNIIDHGRQMQRSFEGFALVDYAVNAALQLSFTAMGNADLAGLVTFGAGQPTLLPPRRSSAHLRWLLETLYNLQPRYAESDFSQLAATLETRAPRHALMVLYTDFYTHDAFLRQLPHLRRIARRHALVVVFFEDEELTRASLPLEGAASTNEQLLRALSSDLVLQKRQMAETLRRNGIHALITSPRHLSGNVVRRYFVLKQRGAW